MPDFKVKVSILMLDNMSFKHETDKNILQMKKKLLQYLLLFYVSNILFVK